MLSGPATSWRKTTIQARTAKVNASGRRPRTPAIKGRLTRSKKLGVVCALMILSPPMEMNRPGACVRRHRAECFPTRSSSRLRGRWVLLERRGEVAGAIVGGGPTQHPEEKPQTECQHDELGGDRERHR